ncbi:hypothetical protein B4U84_30085 [Westiellopsis prolifica IICB1]|nr:hypothetical protein B4U84_30085 [Westiellopsis prolifica IICB1]
MQCHLGNLESRSVKTAFEKAQEIAIAHFLSPLTCIALLPFQTSGAANRLGLWQTGVVLWVTFQ